jgi:hypothetical protein
MIEKTQIQNNPQISYRDYNNSVSSPVSINKTNQESLGLPDSRYMGGSSVLAFTAKIQDQQDKAVYKELSSVLDKKSRRSLDNLLKTGKLLAKDSNDGTSTLQNLYKIYKEPRVMGLDNKLILAETIKTIENPFIITQKFGKIPDLEVGKILAQENRGILTKGIGLNDKLSKQFNNPQYSGPISVLKAEDMDVVTSGTCVAASMEFNLAEGRPAEFARFVAGLTSPELAVKSTIKTSNVMPTMIATADLLNSFGVDHKIIDWDNIEVTLKPDRNAIVRARTESTYQHKEKRSTIDTLMQSTFMQIGSANSYNSLNDIRTGGFNLDNKGLTEFEKDFTEAMVDNSGGKSSITFQNVDENKYLLGYNMDFATTKKYLLDSLKSGSNVIIGITEFDHKIKTNDGKQYSVVALKTDKNGQNLYQAADEKGKTYNISSANVTADTKEIIGGHEITVIGTKKDKNGNLLFICNDTDDSRSEAVEMPESYLLPRIHHAGIPNKLLNLEEQMDSGYYLLNEFSRMQNQNNAAPVASA